MNKTLKFLLTTVWIIITRAYDAFSTFQYTPDLSQEANPLVSILGFGWTPLLGLITLLLIGIIYAYYQSLFHPFDFLPNEKGLAFGSFSIFLYLGKTGHWSSVLYQLPKSGKRFMHYMGCLLTPSLVFAGVVSTLMWLLLNYTTFYPQIHSAPMIYFILLIGAGAIMWNWHKKQYALYQSV